MIGAESTIWFLNAFGLGVGFDRVLSREWRGEIRFGLRLLHILNSGALSLQDGVIEDAITERSYRFTGSLDDLEVETRFALS